MTLTALVDLDGTLTDPADGILGGFEFALRKLDAPVPERSKLGWVIGPPLRQAFPKLLADPSPAAVEAAVEAYRTYYRADGIYQASVYDGVPSALERLRASGVQLLLCTAKPRVFAGPILDHFHLADYFAGIYGAELDGRFDDKGELIAHIIAERELQPCDIVMIGDRGSDMTAASRNRVGGIGVTWGYGSADELRSAGAGHLCEAPVEVPGAVAVML